MEEASARILVVDDEAHLREVLVRGLGRADYECTEARDAESAAELLDQGDFDLVLLDVSMPGKSGVDFLQDIKAEYPDVAVIMLTGIGDVSTAVMAMRDGAYDYATKPASIGELVIRVENALARRALLLENRAYQRKLEQIVDELNARNEQRRRELAALNKLFQPHLDEGGGVGEAYRTLQETLTSFSSEVERLAELTGIASPGDASDGER